ncbi:MAG: hypothetical protein MMC33_004272 [Icmadophila ericetorum]|nr:hypothetical protein [Icmadophila ericetorum]
MQQVCQFAEVFVARNDKQPWCKDSLYTAPMIQQKSGRIAWQLLKLSGTSKQPGTVTTGSLNAGEEGQTFALPMNFLEKTFRDWKVTLLPMAARKPGQLKVTSEVEASATPPTTGKREARTGNVGVSPRNRLDSSTLKKGSIACMPANFKHETRSPRTPSTPSTHQFFSESEAWCALRAPVASMEKGHDGRSSQASEFPLCCLDEKCNRSGKPGSLLGAE